MITTLVSQSAHTARLKASKEKGLKVHVQETHPGKPVHVFPAVTRDSLPTDYSCSMYASDEKEEDRFHGVPSPDDPRTDGRVERYVPESV